MICNHRWRDHWSFYWYGFGAMLSNARIVVLEKEHISSNGNNSGVIPPGIYYKPGSFKAKFCREGSRSMVKFCQQHGIEHEVCGLLQLRTRTIATGNLYKCGLENGLMLLSLKCGGSQGIEPHVRCLAGTGCPQLELSTINKSAKYADLIRSQGGELRLNTKVEKIFSLASLVLETNNGTLNPVVINCAGLHSDPLERLQKTLKPRSFHSEESTTNSSPRNAISSRR